MDSGRDGRRACRLDGFGEKVCDQRVKKVFSEVTLEPTALFQMQSTKTCNMQNHIFLV